MSYEHDRDHIAEVIAKVVYGDGSAHKVLPSLRDPRQWYEPYGCESTLVVVHDGGDLAPYFNWDYKQYDSMEGMRLALEKIGYYPEQCTSWYSAIYPISGGVDIDHSKEARVHISMALDHLEDDCRLDAISALEKALAALRS